MNIVQVVPSIHEEASGPTYSVTRLCRSLVAQQHQLTLVALDWAPFEGQAEFFENISLSIGPKRLGRSPSMFRWLAEMLRRRKRRYLAQSRHVADERRLSRLGDAPHRHPVDLFATRRILQLGDATRFLRQENVLVAIAAVRAATSNLFSCDSRIRI